MTCVECGHTASNQCLLCGAPVCGNCDAAHPWNCETLKKEAEKEKHDGLD